MSIQFSKPNVGVEEANAVRDCILEGHLATGVKVKEFEDAIASKYGYGNVVALNSGTTAITLTLVALGHRTREDEVITTPFTVAGTVNGIWNAGCSPVFADIDRDTYQISVQSIAKMISKRTKAIIPVDVFGNLAPVEEINDLLKSINREDIFVLSDSMACMGGRYSDGSYVGSKSKAGFFGFYPNKQITTCHGSVMYTNDDWLAETVRKLRHQGNLTGDFYDQDFGYNSRLSDPQAVMGLVQLSKFDDKQAKLIEISNKYDELLKVKTQTVSRGTTPSPFVKSIEIPAEEGGLTKIRAMELLSVIGIPTRPYFVNLADLRLGSFCLADGFLDVSSEVSKRTLALPFHPFLTDEEIEYICQKVNNYFGVL